MNESVYWWNSAAVFLLLVWMLQRALPGRRGLIYSLLGAVFLSLVPFAGHPLRFWLSGLTPNACVPLIALLLVGILQRAGIAKVFRPHEWRAAWIFGAVAALLLYPSALGLGLRNFDSYSLGWPWLDWSGSLLLFGPVAAAAALLVWRGNRFGWVIAVAAIAYLFRVQESSNFWDYLLDPLYAALSLCLVIWSILFRRRAG